MAGRFGWSSTDKCGFDLECSKDGEVEQVEVKGVRGAGLCFIVTAGEVKQARTNARFFLMVVTAALSPSPKVTKFSGKEFCRQFNLSAIQYRAILKPSSDRYMSVAVLDQLVAPRISAYNSVRLDGWFNSGDFRMSIADLPLPNIEPPEPWRLSVKQYHAMAKQGILADDDRVELLEGLLVAKMTVSPHHRATHRVQDALRKKVPEGHYVASPASVTLLTSEPEP